MSQVPESDENEAIVPQSRAAARVSRMLAAMLDGTYERGVTSREIAAEQGIAVHTVQKEASIVSHCVDVLADGGKQRVFDAIQARVDAITRKFEAADDVPGARVALEGLRDMARNYGFHGPQKGSGAPEDDDAADALREMLRDPPRWLADMLASLGWMRIESKAG